jgi:hypothetical protein
MVFGGDFIGGVISGRVEWFWILRAGGVEFGF